jgi:small subunit ribosomal protein S16
MVKLRLRRRGRKKHPIYDIAAMDSRKSRNGEYLERIGQYNPMTSPASIIIDRERALYWLGTGAQPTNIVRRLMSVQGVMLELHLGRKGKNTEEIQSALAKHEATVKTRLARKESKRAEKKKKAAESAEKSEEASAE